MNISVCITVFNEEKNISKLIISLLRQTKKPSEIVIVDGGSNDRTVDLIRHFQKKEKRIKLLIRKCSRAEGRNLAVELSRNEIIAMTDAGCIARRDWLEKIFKPFANEEIDVTAGFYDMTVENSMQKAMSVFLGILPNQFDVNFLPSTRSIAFRKRVWEKVGGFPENLKDTAEDTVFNYKLMKEDVKIARVKDAGVEWKMPDTLKEFLKKIYLYAKGDAKSGLWIYPLKGIMSHNLKVLLKIIMYSFGVILLLVGIYKQFILIFLLCCVFIYSYRAYYKVYKEFRSVRVGLWGVLLQYVSDIVAVTGFIRGSF